MIKIFYKYCFAFFLSFSAVSLQAREPYKATIKVNLDSATVTAPNLVDLKRDLSSSSIQDLIPTYTSISPVAFDIDLRGINASAAFSLNSTTLIVNIPQAGITETFKGVTRDESITLFKDFIRDGGTHYKLLKAYAKYSPIDPIAGNPNSLMAQMGQADYMLGHLSPLSSCDCSWSAQPIVNQVQAGVYAGRSFAGGFDTTSITMPLSYSYSPDLNRAFILDAPFTYLKNGGASSVVGSLGIGFRYPVMNDWSLTPVVRVGASGSLDLCTAGAFVSVGVTSSYNYKIADFNLTLTNYAGYLSSTNLWLTGVNFNYHLQNYTLKNGLKFTTCEALSLCGKSINFSFSIIDSFFGNKQLYIRHYDEIGMSLIINYLNPYLGYDCLLLGFSYQFGEHRYKGYHVNLAYQF